VNSQQRRFSLGDVPLTFRLSSAELNDGVVVVTVSGEADTHASPQLQRELDGLTDHGARQLIIDLLETSFIDSAILGVLLRTASRMRAEGGDVALVSDDPRLLRTFEISGLVSQFRFERTLAGAIDHALTASVSP
jgi:anti-sigma B factor antagonist